MSTYNGHKNYNFWNVSLWINNDEGLYNSARYCVRMAKTKDVAAMFLQRELEKMGITHTPDGVKYTKSAIRAAMVGM